MATAAALLLGCSGGSQAASPTEAFRAYIEASKKGDVAAIKSLLSKGSLKMAEDSAQATGQSLDEELKTRAELPANQEMPEIRSEKIEGDAATLEVKNQFTGTWDKMVFAKEDGKWKLAMDKYMEQILKQVEEDLKKADESSGEKKD
jgi:pyruvate kinase